jgi:hypothetical protein
MIAHPFRHCFVPLAALLLAATSGCTSVLSTASLRDLLTASREHAAEGAADRADLSGGGQDTGFDAATTAERRKAAIDEAVTRLARLDHLDDGARATLVATLQRTDQEDWPAVVDAFAESLAATGGVAASREMEPDPEPPAQTEPLAEQEAVAAAASDGSEPAPHVVAKADLDAAREPVPAEASEPPAEPDPASVAAAEPADAAQPAVVEPAVDAPPEPSPEPEPAPPAAPPLTVRNACFATRVQAWGVVDRFAADRFVPGQEVIVYFELDNLSAGESAAGHTTCIDTTLRLVAADGSPLHEWGFEPIAETCRARRHDYFARYVVRVPAGTAAGRHAVELVVTDTLSGQVAKETLPLEIAPEPAAP